MRARSPLLGKFARRVARVTPFILSANVHDHGFRSLSFDFEGGYQGIFRVHDDVTGRPLKLIADGELHQRCSEIATPLEHACFASTIQSPRWGRRLCAVRAHNRFRVDGSRKLEGVRSWILGAGGGLETPLSQWGWVGCGDESPHIGAIEFGGLNAKEQRREEEAV
jgi:hypothetical protein